MRDEERKEPETPPKSLRDFPLESPYYEEQFDPYFTEQVEVAVDQQNQQISDEEDWYWREPDNYWLEEGMWPWPEPRVKRKQEERPTEDIEPK